MMNIKTQVTLAYRDEDGCEEIFAVEQNDISWVALRRFFVSVNNQALPTKRDATSESNGNAARWRIYHGSADVKQSELGCWYSPDGIVNMAVDYPTYTTGTLVTDPDVMRFSAVIQAPSGSPRTIRVLGLNASTGGTGVPIVTDETDNQLTLLRLTTPCVQPINKAIVVTYDVYLYPALPTLDLKMNSELYGYFKTMLKRSADAVNSIFIQYGPYARHLTSSAFNLDNLDSFSLPHSSNANNNVQEYELIDQGLFTPNTTRAFYANSISYALSLSVNATPANGTFVKNIVLAGKGIESPTYNNFGGGFAYQHARPNGDINPVQNVYPQRNNPPGPSQDLTIANTATMTGSLNFDISQWVDPNLQRLVRVNVTNTGAVGVATYKFSVCDFIAGFMGNQWVPRTAIIPQSFRTDLFFRKETPNEVYETNIQLGATTFRSSDNERHVLAADCTRTQTGVNVYDVVKGARYSFNSALGLNVTAVSDGETVSNYYYVTCANTGLWRISLDRTTIEHVPSPTGIEKAFQICKKNDINETIWVLFDSGLCKLSNPNDALGSLTWSVHNSTQGSPTFTHAGLTDNNWATVVSMVIDPDNSENRFLFILGDLPGGDASGNYRKGFVWWDDVTGVAANPGASGVPFVGLPAWNRTNFLLFSDAPRCTDGMWLVNSSTIGYNSSEANYRFTYAASNLNTYFNTVQSQRLIPATVNGVKGVIATCLNTTKLPGFFIRNDQLSTIPNATTLTYASSYIAFSLRDGASSYTSDLLTVQPSTGNLNCSLIYLPNSNFIFSYEIGAFAYGVTPLMLRPTHANYNVYRGAFWRDYGWDGAAWVRDNAGSKTTQNAVEFLSDLDDLGIGFTDGVSGTSFVNGEFFTFAVGAGILKDNGVNTYNCNFWISLDPTRPITITGNVPQAPLGLLTNEPVTFTPLAPSRTSANGSGIDTMVVQNKGILFALPRALGTNAQLVSDQLIPNSTPFNFRFKWATVHAIGDSTIPEIGLATGTGSYTRGIHFRLNRATGSLQVYNNTTLLATVASPDIETECRIERDASNNVVCYYGGAVLHASVITTSQFVIIAEPSQSGIGCGWYDMALTYTENRRILRIGDALTSTGSYSPKFAGLTHTPLALDTKVLIGDGSPLEAILDYTTAGVALTGTGRIKVCTGAGWLVFHDSEPANAITGSTVAHYVLNHQ